MKRIFLFCIVSVILFAVSCHKDKKENCYRDYTSQDIAQLAYKGGETLVFKSSFGNSDTAYIDGIHQSNVTDGGGCPDQRTKKYIQFYGYDSLFIPAGINMIFVKKPLINSSAAIPEFDFAGPIDGWGGQLQ